MARTKESGKDLGLLANTAVQVFGRLAQEKRYRLIEINPHPDHQGVVKHLLAPINLRYVTIFHPEDDNPGNVVILHLDYGEIKITQEEWDRIKIQFGAGQDCINVTDVNSETESQLEEQTSEQTR